MNQWLWKEVPAGGRGMGRITPGIICMATSVDWVIIGVIVTDVLVTGSATLSVTVVDTTASAAAASVAA